MSIDFDITTSDTAYSFLLNTLGFYAGDLIMEYHVECGGDLDLFWECNKHRLDNVNIHDVHFIAFHVTASLDDCNEIRRDGLRDLQYVLSHNTMLARLLQRCDIHFDIGNRKMRIGEAEHDIDYDYFREHDLLDRIDENIESVAHRVFCDCCIDGFFYNDRVEDYGTDIHERPEFMDKLVALSRKAKKLDLWWREKSAPYKVVFYATAEQIHKFTFDLDKNYEPYSEEEQECIKRWMMIAAVDRAFNPCGEKYIYIRDGVHIPPEQIIRYEKIDIE